MTEFLWPLRVYYEDTDSAGVVYYANYLKFMERARTEFVRALGFEQDQLKEQEGIVFVVRNVSLQLHQPARFNDALEVVTSLQKMARTNIVFKQGIRRNGEPGVLCEGEIQVVCVSAESWKPCAIPKVMLQAMNNKGASV